MSNKVTETTTELITRQIVQPGTMLITINRPERRNALNMAVKEQLADAVQAADDDPGVRVIVITGSNGAFVAGTDVAEMQSLTPTEHTLRATDRMFTMLRRCSTPLIAAVERYALGGGCELAMSCDLIVAGEMAQLGQPEILLGIIPGAGGTQRFARTIGKYQALRLLLTGERISAKDAYVMGLVSETVADGQALERALELADQISAKPQLSVRAILEAVEAGGDAPMETALLLERKIFQLMFDTQDQKEGMQAFVEKRTPHYRGQ